MALFDQTVHLQAPLEDVWQAIRAEVLEPQRVWNEKANVALISGDLEFGYFYLTRPQPDGTIVLRHIVDTGQNMRNAFRAGKGQAALDILAQPTPAQPGMKFAAAAAAQRLRRIQAVAEKRLPSEPEPSKNKVEDLPKKNVERFKAGTPWNPGTIIGYIVFATTVGAGIGYALNWRRLGKPEWLLPTILLALLIPFGGIGLLILAARANVGYSLGNSLSLGLAFAIFGANFGYLFALYYLQDGAYKKWEQVGHTAELKAHRYNFPIAAAIVLGLMLLGGVGGSLFGITNYAPREYSGEHFTLTYPPNWGIYPDEDYGDFCEPFNGCLLILSDSRYRYTSILIVRVLLRRPADGDDYEREDWEWLEETYPELILVSQYTMEIDGRTAGVHEFLQPQEDGDDALYGMHVYIPYDGDMLVVNVFGETEGIFEEDRRAIEGILQSMHFINE